MVKKLYSTIQQKMHFVRKNKTKNIFHKKWIYIISTFESQSYLTYMWSALNSSGAVHLFRSATTSSFIHKYREDNPSVQHEGLIYTFFISYNHHLSPSTLPFLTKKPLFYQVQKT